jgi:hypothetical protein
MKAHEEEHERLDRERLEWKTLALDSLQNHKEMTPVLDAVVQGLKTQKDLLMAIKDRAGADT